MHDFRIFQRNSSVVCPEMSEVSDSGGGRSGDEVVLQQTISTGVGGVEQMLQIVENGTDEAKKLVLEEADIILECKYAPVVWFARKIPSGTTDFACYLNDERRYSESTPVDPWECM